MRLTSLLLLILVAGGLVAVFGLNVGGSRDWIFKKAGEGVAAAKGYGAADTPAKAMEYFTKAIKEREYKIAAKYVKGNYKDYLEKAHEAASPLGVTIDWLTTFGKNKQVESPKSVFLLVGIDPFPPYFETVGEPQKEGDDKATGAFRPVSPGDMAKPAVHDAEKIDWKMMTNPLNVMPLFNSGVPMVKETVDGNTSWKLVIDIPNPKIDAINYLIANHTRFQTGLDEVKKNINNDTRTFASKDDFYLELVARIKNASK